MSSKKIAVHKLKAQARFVHPTFEVNIELSGEEIENLHDEVFGIVRTENDERIDYEDHQTRYKSEAKEREEAKRERLKTLKNGYKTELVYNVFELYNQISDELEFYSAEGVLLSSRAALYHEKQTTLADDAEADE